MKRTAPTAVLVLALSTMALAHSTDFSSSGGTLTGTSTGLSLAGSHLVAVQRMGSGQARGDMGAMSLTIGSLKGLAPHGERMDNSEAAFVIAGDGQRGIYGGSIFHGSFVGPATLTKGTLAGQWHGGGIVAARIEELTVKGRSFGGSIGLLSGDMRTQCKTVVPEPGTLGLLGTGLVGLAGVLRLKAKA